MKIFTCIDHDGHYPVGVASVIVARTEQRARELLKAALASYGLDAEQPFTLQPLHTASEHVLILNNGDY